MLPPFSDFLAVMGPDYIGQLYRERSVDPSGIYNLISQGDINVFAGMIIRVSSDMALRLLQD